MLSVTGANFTLDNGSVVSTDFTLPMQPRTPGPVLSPVCARLGAAMGIFAAGEGALCAGKFFILGRVSANASHQ